MWLRNVEPVRVSVSHPPVVVHVRLLLNRCHTDAGREAANTLQALSVRARLEYPLCLDERQTAALVLPLDTVRDALGDLLAEGPLLLDTNVAEDLMLAAEPAAFRAFLPALDQPIVRQRDGLALLALVVPVSRQSCVALLP